MLEFGKQDLDEYLAATYPPVLNEEIIAFWGSLFEIAKTLGRIHQLERVRGDKIQKYVGYVNLPDSPPKVTMFQSL